MSENLFQFWNTPAAPEEVSVLMDGWAVEAGFHYRRFTAETAASYIADHIGARALAAYRACAVPAMQADFFRYCALYHEGGAYVDADTAASGKLADYVCGCSRGMLMTRQDRIANDFLFVRAPLDPLYGQVIKQAIENIEGRVSQNVWVVTGPGIMTHMYHDAEMSSRFDGFDIRPVQEVREVVCFRQDMDYKKGDNDWRKNLTADKTTISIFRDT